MSLDKQLREYVDSVDSIGLLKEGSFGPVSFMLFDKSTGPLIELVETHPYLPDGEIPIIMLNIGRLCIFFENKFLYKLIYKRKYGFIPKAFVR
jgi:hypothetical protein